MTPEHLHLLSNHLPVIGAALGLVSLIVALVARSAVAIRTALAVAAVATAATPVVSWSGEEAEERMEDSRLIDAEGRKWMDIHEERAEAATAGLVVACALCVAALVVGAWKPEHLAKVAAVAAVALAVGLGLGAWAGSAGGKIRHAEIRG